MVLVGEMAAVYVSGILPDQQNETLDELNMSQELRVTRFAFQTLELELNGQHL